MDADKPEAWEAMSAPAIAMGEAVLLMPSLDEKMKANVEFAIRMLRLGPAEDMGPGCGTNVPWNETVWDHAGAIDRAYRRSLGIRRRADGTPYEPSIFNPADSAY